MRFHCCLVLVVVRGAAPTAATSFMFMLIQREPCHPTAGPHVASALRRGRTEAGISWSFGFSFKKESVLRGLSLSLSCS